MEVQIPKSNQHQQHQQQTSNSSNSGGGHRGFGFVMFANEQEAESAIDNMHLNEMQGVSANRKEVVRSGGCDSY
jgi:hypothetical protein